MSITNYLVLKQLCQQSNLIANETTPDYNIIDSPLWVHWVQTSVLHRNIV